MDFGKMVDSDLEATYYELVDDRKTADFGSRKAKWLDELIKACDDEITRRKENNTWKKSNSTFGYYLNIFAPRSYDVYIIFGEANDEPTPYEVAEIEAAIIPILNDDTLDISEKRAAGETKLDDINLNCMEFGYEIVFNY